MGCSFCRISFWSLAVLLITEGHRKMKCVAAASPGQLWCCLQMPSLRAAERPAFGEANYSCLLSTAYSSCPPGVSLDAQAPGFSLPGYQQTSPLARRGSLDCVEGALPKFQTAGGRSCCRMKSLKPDWTTCFKQTNQLAKQTKP